MKPNRSKVELNVLNVGKLGIEQSKLKDSLMNTVHAYMECYLKRLFKEKVETSITMKSVQSVQSNLNVYRRTLGMAQINVMVFLKSWRKAEKEAHDTFSFLIHGETENDQVFEGDIHDDYSEEGEY